MSASRLVPGGWFAVRGRREWWRAALGQVALIWLLPWPMMLVGRFGPAPVHHRLERSWAMATSRLLGLRVEVHGRGHIRPSQPYVVVALHEGLADPLVLWRLGLRLRFVARDELLTWPIVGRYLGATRQLVVGDRSAGSAHRLLRSAARAVGGGESIVVFPQGSVLGIEIAFRSGAIRLAHGLGIPVLPVVITGTHRVWEHPFAPRLRFGQRASVTVLEPVDVRGMGRRDLERVTLRLEAAMKSMALGPGHVAPRRYDPQRDGTWDEYRFVIDPAFGEVARALPDPRRDERQRDLRQRALRLGSAKGADLGSDDDGLALDFNYA